MFKMKTIATPHAPQAIGPYSQGNQVGNLVFFSGQIPLDPVSGQMVGAKVTEQTTQVMKNIQGLVKAVGAELDSIVKTTVFLQSMKDFAAFNEVYASFLKPPFPARSTVEVAALPKGALVEIECIVELAR
jgi:2-iminobutanoate/2-iminopropanoate deaminase